MRLSPALALMMLTLVACSRPSADLSGHVFVLMASGDVKRAGGIGVFIVPATEAFVKEWSELVNSYSELFNSYSEEHKGLDSEWRMAKATEAKAKAEYDVALEAEVKAMYEGYQKQAQAREQARERTNQARKKWTDAMTRTGRAYRRPLDLQQDYSLRAFALIKREATQRVQTDVNGRYEAKGLPTGKAYLVAWHMVFGTIYRWFVSVEVKPGTKTVDLNNANQSWPFDLLAPTWMASRDAEAIRADYNQQPPVVGKKTPRPAPPTPAYVAPSAPVAPAPPVVSATPGASAGTGKTSGVEVAGTGAGGGSALAMYLTLVDWKIQQNWVPVGAGASAETVVVIRFRVLRSGQVRDLELEASSGNAGLDASALRAVRQSQPLPPFPNNLTEPWLDLRYRFAMERG